MEDLVADIPHFKIKNGLFVQAVDDGVNFTHLITR